MKPYSPDFSILDDIINFIGIKDGVETEIPKDSATLPNIDTLKVNATVVKIMKPKKSLPSLSGCTAKATSWKLLQSI